MSFGRALSSVAAAAAVAGCAVVAVGMSRAAGREPSAAGVAPSDGSSAYSYVPQLLPPSSTTAAASSSAATRPIKTTTAPSTAAAPRNSSSAAQVPRPVDPAPDPAGPVTTAPAKTAPVTTVQRSAPVVGRALPLSYSTGSASRVITVVAPSRGSTTATLQAWDKAPGGGWLPHGAATFAYIGSDGMTSTPSESLSATPMGSFTLTQAFGSYGNPGTGLPYVRTNSSDWWISQYGGSYSGIYNTMQVCASSCPFDTADSASNPNEHLMYEQPYYRYAVVIDYNTRNAPGGVRQGAGSAFFLHVANGAPTAGCVAINQGTLVSIMQWLTPSAQPRILIGTG